MDRKSVRLLTVGGITTVVLIVMYILSDRISVSNSGVHYDYEKFVKSTLIVLLTIVAIRITFLVLVREAESKLDKKIPSIIKYIIGAVLLFIASLFIITNIYSQSAIALFMGLGGTGLGVAIIAQNILRDLFSGIVIAFQNDFRVGDWVKFPDGTVAKIVRLKLTGVDLILLNDTTLYVSNSAFTDKSMINLNQPKTDYSEGIKVVLEHDIPIERARRILQSATMSATYVDANSVAVAAESVQANGIVFAIYFRIPNFDKLLEIRHQIISSIAKRLHRHNLRLCEITGQINIQHIDLNSRRHFQDSYVTNELCAIQLSGLLKSCDNKIQEEFAKNLKKLIYKRGEVVCSQGDNGDTMFIVAEGAVCVVIEVSTVNDNEETVSTEKEVAILSDGDYFGEMALLCGEKRSATIRAITDVVLYEVSRNIVKKFVDSYPDFASKLSAAIVERNIENESTKTGIIDFLNKENKEDRISQFMSAFKLFLGG